jgi:hypothetical protein
MGWSSADAFIADITTNNKFAKLMWNRTIMTGATSVAGRWHEILSVGGTGGPMVLTSGTPGTGIIMNRATVGSLPLNANVSTDIRRLITMGGITGIATVVPAYLLLTDIIHIYPSCALTGTPSTLSNHPTWTATGDTRMTDPKGVMVSLALTTAGTAGNGLIVVTYKDELGNAGVSGNFYAPATTTPIGALYGSTGAVVTVGGPFLPLATQDLGVKQIDSYSITTGLTTGVGAFILHRPIATVPIAAVNLAGERDFLTGFPLLPRIYDDACLGMFIQVGGALVAGAAVTGELNYGWGA